jgi:cytochrome P450
MNERVNLLLPEIRKNPYPLYAELRRSHPVCQVDPGGMWAVTRYEDVQHVLRTPEIFSSAGFGALFKPPWLGHNPVGDSMVTMDGPAHTKLRALLSRAFTARSIAQMEPRVAAIAAEQADRLLALGESDFVHDFAGPFPSRVIGELLGLDPGHHERFIRWGAHLSLITPAEPSEEIAASIRESIREMEEYAREIVNARRRAPGDDMVGQLIRADVDGEALTDRHIVAFLFLLLPAGFETTANLIDNTMLGLLERPADLARLRADPSRIPAFVEEILRHDSPVHGILRSTTTEVELGGAILPKGAMVIALAGSANRDEAQFPDAERFDMDRGAQAGLAFGHGAHFCLGASLARMEARLGLEALFARFQGFERLPGELTWNSAVTVRGPLTLPLRFLPA